MRDLVGKDWYESQFHAKLEERLGPAPDTAERWIEIVRAMDETLKGVKGEL